MVGGSGWTGAVRRPVTAPVDAQHAGGNAEKLLTSCPQAGSEVVQSVPSGDVVDPRPNSPRDFALCD